MRRKKRPSLRGSVQQASTTVRVRPREHGLSFAVRASIAGGVLLLFILLAGWAWHSGWIHRQTTQITEDIIRVTQKAHFAVADIVVEGRTQTNKDELFVALEATAGSPIFAFKPSEAEARIAKLPWVETVTVSRRLPDTIYVHLVERIPLARWQHDSRVSVIDVNGKVLSEADPDHFDRLPLLVGAGAPDEANDLLKILHTFPVVEQKVAAAVRVGERRWDLHLPSNVVAKMPEDGLVDALKRLSILITEQKVLERDIVSIDLRIPDRLIIESGSSTPPQRPTNGEGRL